MKEGEKEEVKVEEEGVVEEVQKPLVQIESLVSLLVFSAAVVVFEPLSCSNCHDVVGSSSFQWCTLKKPSDCEQRVKTFFRYIKIRIVFLDIRFTLVKQKCLPHMKYDIFHFLINICEI